MCAVRSTTSCRCAARVRGASECSGLQLRGVRPLGQGQPRQADLFLVQGRHAAGRYSIVSTATLANHSVREVVTFGGWRRIHHCFPRTACSWQVPDLPVRACRRLPYSSRGNRVVRRIRPDSPCDTFQRLVWQLRPYPRRPLEGRGRPLEGRGSRRAMRLLVTLPLHRRCRPRPQPPSRLPPR